MMDKSTGNLENVIRRAYEGHTSVPSEGLLRKLRFNLWVSDFFSLKAHKFNIAYATLILGGIASAILFFPERSEQTIQNIENSQTKTAGTSKENMELLPGKENEAPASELKPEAEAIAAPVASFESSFTEGCSPLKVQFSNKSTASEEHNWDFGTGDKSDMENPSYTFTEPGIYKVSLRVSNQLGIEDRYYQIIKVFASPKAAFSIDTDKSGIAEKKVVFKNQSVGGHKYIWDYGDLTKDTGYKTSHAYTDYGPYDVSLITLAENGCVDTATRENKFIEKNFELYFPVSFRPNPYNKDNNGFYEKAGQESSVFYPSNHGAKEYELSVYAPNGMEIFRTTNIKQGWNGYYRGRLSPGGIYSYKATGIYPNGKYFSLNGKVEVIVDDYNQN